MFGQIDQEYLTKPRKVDDSVKKILLLLSLCIPFIGLAHGVPESTIKAMADASAFDYIYFGATHMLTGYDHILFLIGIVLYAFKFALSIACKKT